MKNLLKQETLLKWMDGKNTLFNDRKVLGVTDRKRTQLKEVDGIKIINRVYKECEIHTISKEKYMSKSLNSMDLKYENRGDFLEDINKLGTPINNDGEMYRNYIHDQKLKKTYEVIILVVNKENTVKVLAINVNTINE